MIDVLIPGFLTSIQDLGRFGTRRFGVGQSGAMDDFAFQIANQMLGNPDQAPGLEITLGNLSLRFQCDVVIAYTGADCSMSIDGVPIPTWSCLQVNAGQTLKTAIAPTGMRSYLCFAGGLLIPELMGSSATDLKGGFGGGFGRALKQGDVLTLSEGHSNLKIKRRFGLARRVIDVNQAPETPHTIRFVKGGAWQALNEPQETHFTSFKWAVSNQSNRLGYRLEGEPLSIQTPELRSHGILPGCIQVPPSGEPVIQLNDANTCGGYPTIGAVIAADMHLLAQARPGDCLKFELCSIEDAVAARRERNEQLADLAKQSSFLRSSVT